MQGKLLEFKVVDADASVAARKNFTDQIGLITAAFYHKYVPPAYDDERSMITSGARPGAGAGTGFGREQQQNLDVRAYVKPGDLWAVINIRYVLQEE